MTIDPTKIRVGDKVTVRTKVLGGADNGGFQVFAFIRPCDILSHTPAPRPFVVGGKVRPVGDYNYRPRTIIAVYPERLWIEATPGWLESVKPCDYEQCE